MIELPIGTDLISGEEAKIKLTPNLLWNFIESVSQPDTEHNVAAKEKPYSRYFRRRVLIDFIVGNTIEFGLAEPIDEKVGATSIFSRAASAFGRAPSLRRQPRDEESLPLLHQPKFEPALPEPTTPPKTGYTLIIIPQAAQDDGRVDFKYAIINNKSLADVPSGHEIHAHANDLMASRPNPRHAPSKHFLPDIIDASANGDTKAYQSYRYGNRTLNLIAMGKHLDVDSGYHHYNNVYEDSLRAGLDCLITMLAAGFVGKGSLEAIKPDPNPAKAWKALEILAKLDQKNKPQEARPGTPAGGVSETNVDEAGPAASEEHVAIEIEPPAAAARQQAPLGRPRAYSAPPHPDFIRKAASITARARAEAPFRRPRSKSAPPPPSVDLSLEDQDGLKRRAKSMLLRRPVSYLSIGSDGGGNRQHGLLNNPTYADPRQLRQNPTYDDGQGPFAEYAAVAAKLGYGIVPSGAHPPAYGTAPGGAPARDRDENIYAEIGPGAVDIPSSMAYIVSNEDYNAARVTDRITSNETGEDILIKELPVSKIKALWDIGYLSDGIPRSYQTWGQWFGYSDRTTEQPQAHTLDALKQDNINTKLYSDTYGKKGIKKLFRNERGECLNTCGIPLGKFVLIRVNPALQRDKKGGSYLTFSPKDAYHLDPKRYYIVSDMKRFYRTTGFWLAMSTLTLAGLASYYAYMYYTQKRDDDSTPCVQASLGDVKTWPGLPVDECNHPDQMADALEVIMNQLTSVKGVCTPTVGNINSLFRDYQLDNGNTTYVNGWSNLIGCLQQSGKDVSKFFSGTPLTELISYLRSGR